jgi:uncharacterized protein (UPF0147 family)
MSRKNGGGRELTCATVPEALEVVAAEAAVVVAARVTVWRVVAALAEVAAALVAPFVTVVVPVVVE